MKKAILLLKFVRWPVFAACVTWSSVKVTLHLRQLNVDMIKQPINTRKQALLSGIDTLSIHWDEKANWVADNKS